MQTLKTLALLAATTALLSVSAKATEYTFEDDFADVTLSSSNPTFTRTVDIAPPYDPASEFINWAQLSIRIFNSDGNYDVLSLIIDPTIDPPITGSTSTRKTFSYLDGEVTGAALGTLRSDGTFTYTVEWEYGGSFKLTDALLIADITSNSQGVPDGGTTLGLLGVAMIGLEWGRRKVAAARSKS